MSSARSLATAVCAWRGHVIPAATSRALDGPLLLGVDVDVADPAVSGAGAHAGPAPAGTATRRLARCLRCDAWVLVPSPAAPTRSAPPPPDELALPRRGRALRSAVVMRLIAIERAVHAVIFGLVAVLAIALRSELVGVQSQVRQLLGELTSNASGTGNAFGGHFIVKEGSHLLTLKTSTLDIVIAAAIAYFVVEGVEAIGLWRERRWAEYLTVLATAGFIPYEVVELMKGVSVLKVGALVVNGLILVYLLWSKELFGLGRLRRRRVATGPSDPLEPFRRPYRSGPGDAVVTDGAAAGEPGPITAPS